MKRRSLAFACLVGKNSSNLLSPHGTHPFIGVRFPCCRIAQFSLPLGQSSRNKPISVFTSCLSEECPKGGGHNGRTLPRRGIASSIFLLSVVSIHKVVSVLKKHPSKIWSSEELQQERLEWSCGWENVNEIHHMPNSQKTSIFFSPLFASTDNR